jgi:hypothetical protein
MATLIESWGGSGSNVYISLTAAHSYITNAIYDSSAWSDATTAQREAALIEATIHVDRLTFIGRRYYPDQRLAMPRAVDNSIRYPFTTIGTPSSILQTQMKDDVERATCYQALYICRNAGRNIHNERIQSGISALSEAVGPIKEFVQYNGSAAKTGGGPILCQDTLDLLSRWRQGRRVVRG